MQNFTKVLAFLLWALVDTAAFAAINGPTGLALDSNGNLYVANFNSNQILVFSPHHSLISSKTVTQGVSGPTAVAIDPMGNLWVANFSSSSITGYTPTKQPLTPITDGVSNPTAMAIDGAGNYWVVNAASSFAIYDAFGDPIRSASSGIMYGSPTTLYSIAAFDGSIAFGNDAQVFLLLETVYLATNTPSGEVLALGHEGVAMSFDSSTSLLWEAESDGSVYINGVSGILTLRYRPSAMVLDSARKLLYFANDHGNTVDVYTTKGAYVTTIH